MRYYLLLLLFVAPSLCFAQSVADSIHTDSVTKQVIYEGVAEVPGAKDDLYNRAKTWFADASRKVSYVVETQDKEAGTLAGRGAFEYTFNSLMQGKKKNQFYATTNKAAFTIKVFVKDNKYKYIITDLVIEELFGSQTKVEESQLTVLNTAIQNKKLDEYTYQNYSALNKAVFNLIGNLKIGMTKKAETEF